MNFLDCPELNTFQSSHFVQLFNFKKRNPQGRLVFFSSQTGRSKHSEDIQLHFGKLKGKNVVNCEDVQNTELSFCKVCPKNKK